jgi:hypothetical protein
MLHPVKDAAAARDPMCHDHGMKVWSMGPEIPIPINSRYRILLAQGVPYALNGILTPVWCPRAATNSSSCSPIPLLQGLLQYNSARIRTYELQAGRIHKVESVL